MAEMDRNISVLGTRTLTRTVELKKAGLNAAAYQQVKTVVHRDLLKRLDLEKVMNLADGGARSQIFSVIQDLVGGLNTPLSGMERQQLAREVLNEVFGLGPLEPLLEDPTISDILVNTHKQVYVERAGLLEKTNVVFKDDAHLMQIIERIVSAVGRRVDESSPMVDARLADGSRVNCIIPPLAIDGPYLSIRRFGHVPLQSDDLLANRSLTPQMLELLKGAIKSRLNIVISGGTGAGKTTLLNCLSGFISDKERIVTIEDSAELLLKQEHVVRLECRPANVEGRGAIMQRQLLINSLRMRPDRIIIGEVRGDEALDMLQAMNTGHDGSMSTIHSNSPRDALSRVETMVLMAGYDLPVRAIREQVSSALECIIYLERLADGSRRVTSITEVQGMETDVITLQELFKFQIDEMTRDGTIVGSLRATGLRPNS